MKKYIDDFIAERKVYRSNLRDFLLFKDLVEYVRQFDLTFKISDLRTTLEELGWKENKISVATTEGYLSKDVWIAPFEVENTRSLPVVDLPRRTLADEEEIEAKKVIRRIYDRIVEDDARFNEVTVDKNILLFTNKGLKSAVENIGTIGKVSSIAAIIRRDANKVFAGQHFYGLSSRTISYKNYYKIEV